MLCNPAALGNNSFSQGIIKEDIALVWWMMLNSMFNCQFVGPLLPRHHSSRVTALSNKLKRTFERIIHILSILEQCLSYYLAGIISQNSYIFHNLVSCQYISPEASKTNRMRTLCGLQWQSNVKTSSMVLLYFDLLAVLAGCSNISITVLIPSHCFHFECFCF